MLCYLCDNELQIRSITAPSRGFRKRANYLGQKHCQYKETLTQTLISYRVKTPLGSTPHRHWRMQT